MPEPLRGRPSKSPNKRKLNGALRPENFALWNGAGTFSLNDTVTANTAATAAEVNAIFQDLATGISAAVAKNGENAFTGQMKAANGTVSAPGITFGSDLNLGLYRIGADNLGVTLAGSKVGDWTATGLTITGTLTASGIFAAGDGAEATPGITFGSDLNSGFYRIGADNIALSLGGSKVVDFLTTGVAITGTLSASGNFAINTDKFTVAAASGNTLIAGTADITGNVAVATNKFTVAAASGNTAIAGTLAITGATTATAAVTAPNTPKAFASFSVSGTTVTFTAAEYFNIATIERDSEGVFDVTFTNALPTANYVVMGSGLREGGGPIVAVVATSKLTTGFTLTTYFVTDGVSTPPGDPAPCEFLVCGF